MLYCKKQFVSIVGIIIRNFIVVIHCEDIVSLEAYGEQEIFYNELNFPGQL